MSDAKDGYQPAIDILNIERLTSDSNSFAVWESLLWSPSISMDCAFSLSRSEAITRAASESSAEREIAQWQRRKWMSAWLTQGAADSIWFDRD